MILETEMKIALITGITGQDGSYLAEFLIEKGYQVHGLLRRSSTNNTDRLQRIFVSFASIESPLKLHYGDLTDASALLRLISEIKPDEIYNLAAQSHVGVSCDTPEYTADVNGLGTLRILEAVRILNMKKKTKIYQASTSELYGEVQEIPQTEKTPFYPRSPYAVSKLFAFWIVVNYREAYGLYACNGILFNHESYRRGEEFVTRKITKGLANVFFGFQDHIELGNLSALRDWGHARDYVRMQWLMLQQDEPTDYVIATGNQISVRQFTTIAAEKLGINIIWKHEGLDEIGVVDSVASECDAKITVGQTIVRVNPKYYRASEVDSLLGDSSKARQELKWEPEISLEQMIDEMLEHDLKTLRESN